MSQGGDTRGTGEATRESSLGRYRLLERLGQGGMAEVFKAKSYGVEGFEKVVVIKRILPELAASEQFVDMFIHEAKLAVRLSHANVVQVFDLGLAPAGDEPGARDAYYMAMEYVSGFDLASVLTRCRRQQLQVPIEMAVYVAAEVAKGLDHAHRRRDEQGQPLNIVHLDVSPQNVLCSLEGEVKVTDFGIAKARGALDPARVEDTQARQLQGKFAYMSPEHAAGEPVDARADLFSLGTVLYEMLTGVNPFSGPTSFETLRRVIAVEVPPVELLRPDLPKELMAILATAMAKAPSARFPDAGRMYEALLAFLYAQGRRFSAHDLAAFLQTFRAEEAPAEVVLDAEAPAAERTPVEIPLTRVKPQGKPPSSRPSLPATVVDVDRAAEMGEHREVTVLAIELPARDDREAGARAAETVERYGGRVLAREPEQVVALFGEGVPDGRDTEVATRCALVVLRSLADEREAGAGLHVGRVHVTSDGRATDDERLASLVQTARDLSRAEEGACAISSAAVRQVQNLFVVDGHKDRKTGLTSPSSFLVREVRAPSEAFGRFIGRKDELHAVGEMLASATRRVASVLTVRGDHGVGKTRLLLEVERRLKKGGYNVGWYFATCVPRGTELPLSGIQAMLQTLCGIAEGDPEHRIRQVAPRLRALGLQDDEVSAVLGALGAASAAGNGGPPQKGSLTAAFMRMVQRLCEDRPHAFAWDAAHGMDDESFDVLRATLERLPHTRVLFVLTTRAGFAHPLEKLAVHAGLDLADLDPDDAERLVAQRLTVARVPGELLRFVRDRAGGHPQMIEEVLKALLESRAITVADGAVVTMKLTQQELALPKTLRGLVASRVARLEAKDRAILQAAAVLGDPLNVGVLASMTGVAAGALERTLAKLEERSFLVHTSAVELRFTSPIAREVVTFALTPEVAREMHAAAGRALSAEESHASEHASRIAAHLYEAGDLERAGVYFAASAERRMDAGQLEAAARDWARAFDLVELGRHETAAVVAWFSRMADAVDSVRALAEPLEVCERVIARVDAGPFAAGHELEGRVKVRIDAGRILGAVHLLDAARTQLAAAEAIAQGDANLVSAALVASSQLASRQGDFKRALGFLERLQELAAKTGRGPAEEHTLRLSLAQTCAAMGDRTAALRHLDRANAVLPSDARATTERHKTRAIVEYFARDFAAAAGSFERAVDAARELGLSHEIAANLHNLGDVLVRQGDHARAYGALKQSLALATDHGYVRIASHDRMFLAYLDARAGDPDAEARLVAGIRYAEGHEFTLDVLGGRLLHAQLLDHRGEADLARAEYQKLRELARAAGNRLVEADCVAALSGMGMQPSQPPPPPAGPGGLTL